MKRIGDVKMAGSHIAIPTILKVGKGTLGNLGMYLQANQMKHAVIYFGNGLIEMFGNMVMQSLKEQGVTVVEYRELDSIRIEDIIELAFSIDVKTQVIVGIGGGKVIDAAKYAAYLRKLPFVSVPTSASSDGFSSASASLLVDGKRNSVPARMAYGIIADTDIIKSAPEKFLYSGIGDLVSKITALYDWVYEDENGYAVNEENSNITNNKKQNYTVSEDDLINEKIMQEKEAAKEAERAARKAAKEAEKAEKNKNGDD